MDCGQELSSLKRLKEGAVGAEHSGGGEEVEVSRRSPARDGNDFGVWELASEHMDESNSRYRGHHEVNDEKVNKILTVQGKSALGVRRFQHLIARLLQHRTKELAESLFVVND